MRPTLAIVAAHPDDETVGAAGLLLSAGRAAVVHLTDGAPRDPRLPYVGLVHTCVSSSPEALERSFGPVRYQANRNHATRPPPRLAPLPTLALAGVLFSLVVSFLV